MEIKPFVKGDEQFSLLYDLRQAALQCGEGIYFSIARELLSRYNDHLFEVFSESQDESIEINPKVFNKVKEMLQKAKQDHAPNTMTGKEGK